MPFRSPFGKKNRGNHNNPSTKYKPKFSQLIVSDSETFAEDNNEGIKQPANTSNNNTASSTSDSTPNEINQPYAQVVIPPDIVINEPKGGEGGGSTDCAAYRIEMTDRRSNLNRYFSASTASTLSTARNRTFDNARIEVDTMTLGSTKADGDDTYVPRSVLTEHTHSNSSILSYLNDLGKGNREKNGKKKTQDRGTHGAVHREENDQNGSGATPIKMEQETKNYPSITFKPYGDTLSPRNRGHSSPSMDKNPLARAEQAPVLLTPSMISANVRRSRSALRNATAVAERDYWKEHLTKCVLQYGPMHSKVADCLLCLGGAHMKCKEYDEALSVYKSTVQIQRQIHGNNHISVGRALDRVGLAASYSDSPHNYDWAVAALNEAFLIRYNTLGPHHCDTADTLNNIAGVHLRRNELEEARQAYTEVLTVRAAIMGPEHPAVAVTAHTLGKVYMRVANYLEALRHFEFSLRIYCEAMRLKDTNPTVAKVLKDKDSTERMMVSMGYR
mmetsp:Transcript_40926/g.61288  ORF Transcript_40926/g.61288 Transcript_40926/m.61288 type:complete len:502 (-) Transcript_40926:166-1671(-)